MEGRVLVVEPNSLARGAVQNVLDHHGYQVLCVDSAAAATRLPNRFECGVFSDALPDASAIALAGWFLVERRIACAVFFGVSPDVEFRLRASNLGTFVARGEGLQRLERAVKEAIADQFPQPLAVGGETIGGGLRSTSVLRRHPRVF